MDMKTNAKVLTLTAILAMAVGCSGEPTEEIQSVNREIEAARTDFVRTYAAESLAKAEMAVAEFNQEIEAQKEKWALSRDYETAEALAEEARNASKAAIADAEQAKEAIHQQALARLDQARKDLDTAEQELGTAPVGKGSRADIELMRTEILAARQELAHGEQALATEQYQQAMVIADQVIDTARQIIESVKAAREMKASGQSSITS